MESGIKAEKEIISYEDVAGKTVKEAQKMGASICVVGTRYPDGRYETQFMRSHVVVPGMMRVVVDEDSRIIELRRIDCQNHR